MPFELGKISALVVDDNRFIRSLLHDVLAAFGIKHVRQAVDGGMAFALLKQEEADIVFVDWMMEPVDGIEFTKQVRNREKSPCPFVPIIMVTSDTEKHRVERARDVGVTEFIVKPITPSVVYSRIQTIIVAPRPFVDVGPYFGPDRRRSVRDFMGEDKRSDGIITD